MRALCLILLLSVLLGSASPVSFGFLQPKDGKSALVKLDVCSKAKAGFSASSDCPFIPCTHTVEPVFSEAVPVCEDSVFHTSPTVFPKDHPPES